MRIIIDMQGLQTIDRVRGIGRYTLSLVKAIVNNAGDHDVFLILNSNFPESIVEMRSTFAGLLSEQNIRVFETPLSVLGWGMQNSWQLSATEIINKHIILGLKPDALILTQGLSEKWTDLLTYRDDLINKLGLTEEQVIVLRGDQECSDIKASAICIIDACQAIKQQNGQEICNHSQSKFQGQRPRLAFVSPLPPEKTGIADYSAELLPELAGYYDIELITNQQELTDLWPEFSFPVRTIEWFKLHAKNYDRILYHLGNNSMFHGHMLALLNEVPGVVILHDFFLSHLMANMEINGYQKDAWTDSLFQSHGYAALQQRFQVSKFETVLWYYPCNLNVLQAALGVIVHSKNTKRLAAEWIDERAAAAWAVIPLLRSPAQISSRAIARATLNISPEQFVVCSFGMLGPGKLNQRLLDAWFNSVLSKNEHCLLVFVGENDAGDYGKKLLSTIKGSGIENRILITGWTDSSRYRDYLTAADLGVQLRTLSRGETSAAVLDCMNYGLPTIVNANGAMADLPVDAVWMLPDDFTDTELVIALEKLWQDVNCRQQLGNCAKEVILTQHKPSVCAQQYVHAIESMYQRAQHNQQAVLRDLAALDNLPDNEDALEQIANAVAASFPPELLLRQLLIDTSSIVRHDLKTGIERVVRSQLLELIKNPPKGFRVEPIYLSDQGGKWHYRYARTYTCKILDIEQVHLTDTPIDVNSGDVFYAPDFFPGGVIEAAKFGLYLQWQARGVSINFLIHDLLPIQYPQFFPDGANILHESWLKTIAESSTRLLCISNAVVDGLMSWLEAHKPPRVTPLIVDVLHHGADINISVPLVGLPNDRMQLLNRLSITPTFIMVGTLEPRKGHLQTLAAFELLWKQGLQVNLVIVGKQGWLGLPDGQRRSIPQLVKTLRQHQQLGQRLFWLEDSSDEYLQKLYAISACLIVASEGEGFGLPLIEAAHYKLPIIARDIPVFREVAIEHAYYFKGTAAVDLEQSIKQWLALYVSNKHPLSDDMPYLTWAENASKLGRVLSNALSYDEESLSHSILYKPKKKLYVDITVVYREDFKTGIQRVVRAILAELIKNPPPDYEVCPAYIDDAAGSWDFYSVQACSSSLGNTLIHFNNGDILLGLDLAGGYVVKSFHHGLYSKLMAKGVLVYFVVYDLLPVLAPHFFSPEAAKGHEQWLRSIAQSDGVICISKAVADEFIQWFHTMNMPLPACFMVDYFHLGADIAASDPTMGLPDDAGATILALSACPSFLMVGTLEPRKGHTQTLTAFEQLWGQGLEVNLVIVGKQGWEMNALVERLWNHPERDKHLFWLEGISDEYLEKLYAASTCLIVASEGEGFGLPLIEAAQHKLPIIVRDIPVFREVAGNDAFYFKGNKSEALAQAIKEWLVLHKQGIEPDSNKIVWQTWAQSAQQLMQRILPKY